MPRAAYEYDPLTSRLARLQTRRSAGAFPDDAPQASPAGWPGRYLQNLSYTYDPAGNVMHIQDDAQQTIYFKNKRVEPSSDYTYDALYRLIDATGREHLGQGGASVVHSSGDAGRVGVHSGDAAGHYSASDGNAMGAYVERYVYDAVGNLLEMQHRGGTATAQGWTRGYTYAETSLIEDGSSGALPELSNRLTSTTVNPNGTSPQVEPYEHDAHGNIVRMPHLGGGLPDPNMLWDYKDRLRATRLGGGGEACYVYDGSGERVRKVWAKSAGLVEERIYLGGFEVFRRHTPGGGGAVGAATATFERETLHVMDDTQRVALVETRTLDTTGGDPAAAQLVRYQLGNHLGSASLELDDHARVISYEEYTPYGSSSYQAVRIQTETGKRYRYTGMERDEESGLNYHRARYVAVWFGRWVSCDPQGLADGTCLYAYGRSNPLSVFDRSGRAGVTADDLQAVRVAWLKGALVAQVSASLDLVPMLHPAVAALRPLREHVGLDVAALRDDRDADAASVNPVQHAMTNFALAEQRTGDAIRQLEGGDVEGAVDTAKRAGAAYSEHVSGLAAVASIARSGTQLLTELPAMIKSGVSILKERAAPLAKLLMAKVKGSVDEALQASKGRATKLVDNLTNDRKPLTSAKWEKGDDVVKVRREVEQNLSIRMEEAMLKRPESSTLDALRAVLGEHPELRGNLRPSLERAIKDLEAKETTVRRLAGLGNQGARRP
jgi:RHS repeat-associated protein